MYVRLEPASLLPLLKPAGLTALDVSHNFLSASGSSVDEIKEVRALSYSA